MGDYPVCPNVVCIHRGLDQKGDDAETFANWITAHEVGHQYFGFSYVLEPLDYPQWFGISMGIYTDWFYTRSRNLDRDHYGFLMQYVYGAEQGYNTTVMHKVDSLEKQGFDWNNVIMHGKSFAILRMLAYEVGEDTFFKIYTYCLRNFQGVNVTPDLFQQTCEDVSGRDLDWFFDQWYRTNKYLEYNIASVHCEDRGNGFHTSCRVERTGEAVVSSLEVGIRLADSTVLVESIDGRKDAADIILDSDASVIQVMPDPNRRLPLVNRRDWENHAESD